MFSSAVRMRRQHRLAVFIQSLQNAKIKACLIWTNGRFVFHAVCSHARINMKVPMWSQYLTDINNCNLWRHSDVCLDNYCRLQEKELHWHFTRSLSRIIILTSRCTVDWFDFHAFYHLNTVREFIKIWKPKLKAISLLTKILKEKKNTAESWCIDTGRFLVSAINLKPLSAIVLQE